MQLLMSLELNMLKLKCPESYIAFGTFFIVLYYNNKLGGLECI
jgi:hypothetical protein